jgi:hypothetical protein
MVEAVVNETAAGRDGFILAMGRRIYHVYKQDFPMEFIYGLTPDANREYSPGLVDVRTLPEKYHATGIHVAWLQVQKRSAGKRIREQLEAHAMTFAYAIADGYDLEGHARREEEAALRISREYREFIEGSAKARAAAGEIEDDDIPF